MPEFSPVDFFDVPDPRGLLGIEREQVGKAAGLRTHMLVALGAALFTVAAVDAGMNAADLSACFRALPRVSAASVPAPFSS